MYYTAAEGETLTGLDGKVRIPLDGFPVPLLEEDYRALDGGPPSYDAVGRGIYHVLRADPECSYVKRYVRIFREAYPHFLSEMASHIVMLDKKDVDVAYLGRKINYLKVFALIEPETFRFPLEIGLTYADKGLRLCSLHLSTMNLYKAEEYLRKAVILSPSDVTARYHLGEVSYILGKYDDALFCWRAVLAHLDAKQAIALERRIVQVADGIFPTVPVVDYLEAIAAAFSLHQQGEFQEAAAILLDVMDDSVFREQFPIPEISYILGLCCAHLGMPRYAEDYFRAALQVNPVFTEALKALEELSI